MSPDAERFQLYLDDFASLHDLRDGGDVGDEPDEDRPRLLWSQISDCDVGGVG